MSEGTARKFRGGVGAKLACGAFETKTLPTRCYGQRDQPMKRLVTIAIVGLAAVLPHVVLAQDSEGQHELKQLLRAQIKQTLESAGFTDVQVIPTSLLVRTKDPAGSPVTMFINPQSFMALSVSENHENNVSLVPMNSVADNNEKSSAAANASLDDYKANLTAAQKQVIWQNLSSVKTRANEPKQFTPQIGATIPNEVSIQPLPDEITNDAPSLKGYHYTMLQKEVVIVHPTSKKIVDLIREQ